VIALPVKLLHQLHTVSPNTLRSDAVECAVHLTRFVSAVLGCSMNVCLFVFFLFWSCFHWAIVFLLPLLLTVTL